jgi:membrane associated rhomboid family serine protease
MSIYNRSYMREERRGYREGPWALKGILITLVAVFLLQNIVRHWFGSFFIEEHFALSMVRLSEGWLHTLLTYGLLHSTQNALPWHLVLNGLVLYWFGREIEARLGSDKFLECFLLSILVGGILWFSVHYVSGQGGSVVGASSGVFGMIYLFCRFHWQDGLSLLFLPIRFTGKQLFAVLFAFQLFFLLFAELPGQAGNATAYSAHIGGVLGAFVYERYLLTKASLLSLLRPSAIPVGTSTPQWRKRPKVAAGKETKFTINMSSRGDLRKEVDRILDKINHEGFGALSAEEKATLDKAKDQL